MWSFYIFEPSFGHLACFTSDVEDFLLVLSLDKKTKLLERLKSSSTSHSKESIKELGRFITLKKIQELIGNTYKLPVDGLSLSSSLCIRAHTYTLNAKCMLV